MSRMLFPDNKRFAFSILDDTDDSTLENVKPVYDVLRHYGLRATKTVWPLDCPEGSRIFFAAETLQHKPYLEFVHELADGRLDLALLGREVKIHAASLVTLQAMNTHFRPAITLRQSPPSVLPRRPALAATECGLWLGAHDSEEERHHLKGH